MGISFLFLESLGSMEMRSCFTWLLSHPINFGDIDIDFLTSSPKGEVRMGGKGTSLNGGAHIC